MAVSDLARARTALVRATHSTRTIFGSTVGGLGVAEGFAGQHDRGGSGRISIVGFAVACPALPFGAADLGDRDALGAQIPGQARAVVAGAFDTDDNDLAQPASPGHELAVAGGAGCNAVAAQRPAQLTARATWNCLCVSTPTVTCGWVDAAMVDCIAAFL